MDFPTATVRRALLDPDLHSWDDLIAEPKLPPKKAGVYGWYFDSALTTVPRRGCNRVGRRSLLYVGISPSRPGSKSSLRSRIRYHFRGNVSGSTLRTSLACLLGSSLHHRLRRVGAGGTIKLTHGGEAVLREWMSEHARVCWVETPSPWEVEGDIIRSLRLPLNLQGNADEPFVAELKALRAASRSKARSLPIVQH